MPSVEMRLLYVVVLLSWSANFPVNLKGQQHPDTV